MRVAKWGNSLAVRLPAAVVEALQLNEGDEIDVQSASREALVVSKAPTTREVIESLREFRGRMPAGFKFDRDEANER